MYETDEEGVYKMEKDVRFYTHGWAPTYEFQVYDPSSSTDYPSDQYIFGVPLDGDDHKFVITYNSSTHEVNAYIEGIYVGIHGEINNKGLWENTEFTPSQDKKTASYTFTNVQPGTYEFGVRMCSDQNWTANAASITSSNSSVVIKDLPDEGNNCSFTADIPGNYTFTWTYATNTMTVTYPSMKETPLTFEAMEDGAQVTYTLNSTRPIQYSVRQIATSTEIS